MSGDRVKRRLAEYRLVNYRPGVGILLLSRDGLAFVGHRIIMPAGLARWQMPQGGIDTGEAPRLAGLRELRRQRATARNALHCRLSVAEEIEWFVGIDWASQSHQVCPVDARGECLGERAVTHGGPGIEDLCDWLIARTGATREVTGWPPK